MSAIFKDQGEEVVMVELPNIWYLWKALNVLFTGHEISKKFTET